MQYHACFQCMAKLASHQVSNHSVSNHCMTMVGIQCVTGVFLGPSFQPTIYPTYQPRNRKVLQEVVTEMDWQPTHLLNSSL